MTTKRRSEVERVADEMAGAIGYPYPNKTDIECVSSENWELLAAWHLREVRRAKGKSVGYVFLKRESDESGEDCWLEIKHGLITGPVNVRMAQMIHDEVARVVLVPRRRKR